MSEPFFWDCVDEFAPFGSDEGSDAYYEWREWRERNPSRPLTDCLSWICDGNLSDYNAALHSDGQAEHDIANSPDAFLAEQYDMFTLDTTIITTALGQLMDEGTIDAGAKPYVYVAIARQLHPSVCEHDERRGMLAAIKRVVDAA